MAKKDWKKRKNGFWNSKKLQLITIRKTLDDDYEVRLNTESGWDVLRFEKKKSQAVKFAKSYIRKH